MLVAATAAISRRAAQYGVHTPRRLLDRLPRNTGPIQRHHYGIRLPLNLRDNTQRELFYFGSYEPATTRLLLDELGSGHVLVDAGAAIGMHALPAAKSGARVFAFEPAPDSAGQLERVAHEHGLETLTVVRAALAATPGKLPLRASAGWDAADQAVRSLHGSGEPLFIVPVIVFDEWAADLDRLDVVKLDVEGGETDALKGMRQTIVRLRPRLLVVEVVPSLLTRAGSSVEALARLVEELGYEADGPSVFETAAKRQGAFWPNVVLRPR
jgi:FkbM family methyltransferase